MPGSAGLLQTSRQQQRRDNRGCYPRAHASGRGSVCSAGPQSLATSHQAAVKMPKGQPFWKSHKPHRQTAKESKTTSAASQERCQAQQQQKRLDKRTATLENRLKPTATGRRGQGLMGHESCCAWKASAKGNQPDVTGIHTVPETASSPLTRGQLVHVHPPVSPDTCIWHKSLGNVTVLQQKAVKWF